MKKRFYSFLCGTALILCNSYAERGALVMPLLPQTVLEYQVLHVSPNGEWACGVINNGTFSGWVWNLKTGQLTELTPVGVSSTAWQVSDDGTVAGTFLDTQATGNGAAVEAAGYWKDGKWHHLEMAGETITSYDEASTAYAISGNGKIIGGQAVINGTYTPVLWENGTLKILNNHDNGEKQGKAGAVLTVSDNGTATGWTYYPNKTGTSVNRACAMWTPDLKILSPDNTGPFCEARISPDGKYVAAFNSVYDTETDKYTEIDFSGIYSYQFTAITNSGTLFGFYSPTQGMTRGCVVKDGKFIEINQYLQDQGVNLGEYTVAQVLGVSADGKTLGTVAFDAESNPRTVIIKLDEDLTTREPAGIDAMTLEGSHAVELKWRKPLAGAEGVKGYEILRDGTLLKSFNADVFTYIDTNVPVGQHSYTAKAVYADAVSKETYAANIMVENLSMSAPRNAMAVQARVNDVRLLWDAPESTLPALQYYSDNDDISGIGWSKYSIECGSRFTAGMFATYGNDVKIAGITFYPMSKQEAWTVNIYSADDTKKPLYTENIDADKLVYGTKNTIKLSVPFAVPADKDIVIGVAAVVPSASVNVFGRTTGKKRIGESDLFRRTGIDEDFFSMYNYSMSAEGNAAEENTTWALGVLIQSENFTENTVSEYKISENGTQLKTSATGEATLKDIADGEHVYGIAAVYADGKVSENENVSINVIKDMSPYNISNLNVRINGLKATATWNAPKNDDSKNVSWATGNESSPGLVGAEEYNGTYTAAAKYSGSILRPYKGYQIKAFRFMPLAKAYFSFTLTKNGEEVIYRDVMDDEYKLGSWNTIFLDSPVELDANAEYILAIECFEPEDGRAPLGIDKYMSHASNGDLFKQGADEDFKSLSSNEDYNYTGNWMIGMVVATAEGDDLGVKGYNIRSGNKMTGEKLLNESPVTDTSFEYTFDKTGNYNLRVSPVFGEPVGELMGETVTFTISSTGISENKVDIVRVYPNPATTYIKADGNVKSIAVYGTSGSCMAKADGGIVDVSGLGEGLYIVSVELTDGEYNTKVRIVR